MARTQASLAICRARAHAKRKSFRIRHSCASAENEVGSTDRGKHGNIVYAFGSIGMVAIPLFLSTLVVVQGGVPARATSLLLVLRHILVLSRILLLAVFHLTLLLAILSFTVSPSDRLREDSDVGLVLARF